MIENEETYNKEISINCLSDSNKESPGRCEEIKQIKKLSAKRGAIPSHLTDLLYESTKEIDKDVSIMVENLGRLYQDNLQKDNDLGRLDQSFGECEIPPDELQ